MPLDRFKTQVLLLHSEQSTLDSLSSGFGEGYTVHCATTGSEALNTLVDTPINIIVSAQRLPGMSGLEALREAKKRSPDTIGILLAENEDKGLEAMVGDKEVFQIVRGDITGDSISRLVDNATQQMRLMALANSANDSAADVEEAPAEHIVMETSENGSTIISDGTGSMPALDPTKISAASAVGSHSVDLLVLTKDDEFLETIKESSRGTHGVHYASTLAQADQIIRKQKVGVAVVDAAMVGEKIEQLTAHLRKGSPRLVSIVAGRRDDGEMMMDLINRSKVYRFLLKPVSPGRARLAVEASVKHHLEAPDAAFKTKGSGTPPAAVPPKPQATPTAKPEPKPEPKAVPEPKAMPASKAAAAQGGDDEIKASTGTYQIDPPLGASKLPKGESPNDDALSSAFGDEDSNFTETVTGLFATVSKKFSKDENDEEPTKPASDSEEPTPVVDTEPAAAASSGGSLLQDPKVIGLGIAAIVVVAGALFWLMGGSDEAIDSSTPVAGTPVTTEEQSLPAVDASGTDMEVPDVAQQISQAIAGAESALLQSRIDDASAALELLGQIDPGNDRLPFLTAQLAQIQFRSYLDDARAAIRESRFEDASNALAAARSLDLPDSTEIGAAELELSAALDEQQADDVLALANARLDDGDLLNPPNDNARYYFQLALSRDSENVAARQGLGVIASKLAMQARIATDDGNLDDAEVLLAESNALDPDNSELAAAITALADRRAAIATERREAEAQRRAAAEQRAADERAAAEREAEQQRAAAAAAAAPAEEPATGANEPPVVEAASLAADQPVASNDENPGSAAGTPDETGGESTAAVTNTPVAAASQTPTSVRDMNRTKYVAPKYPRAAQRRNLSGWVDVFFTVDSSGMVKDVIVRDSEPGDTFVAAATRAVEKWEFEPVIENGRAVEKTVGVRMMFALE